MILELDTYERIFIQAYLPSQGRRIEMSLSISIEEVLRFTPAEITKYQLKDNDNGSVSWNGMIELNSFEFTPEQIDLMAKSVSKGVDLNDEANLVNPGMIRLEEKINALRVWQ